MTKERWEEIRERIRSSFKILDEFEEDLEPGVATVIEFSGPNGEMQAVYSERPRVVGKKTLYAHRGSAGVSVSYDYDEKDLVGSFELFQKADDGSWKEIDSTVVAGS